MPVFLINIEKEKLDRACVGITCQFLIANLEIFQSIPLASIELFFSLSLLM